MLMVEFGNPSVYIITGYGKDGREMEWNGVTSRVWRQFTERSKFMRYKEQRRPVVVSGWECRMIYEIIQ